MAIRKELGFVTKVYETIDLDEAAEMLTQDGWVMIAAAKGKDSYLFSLGYMDFSGSRVRDRATGIQSPAHSGCRDHRGRTSQVNKDDTQSRLQSAQEKLRG